MAKVRPIPPEKRALYFDALVQASEAHASAAAIFPNPPALVEQQISETLAIAARGLGRSPFSYKKDKAPHG